MEEGVDFNVSVVLPAGGCGERFNGTLPKQYNLLLQQPVFLHTILAFHRLQWVQHIALVVHKAYLEHVQDTIDQHKLNKVIIVEGGTTRHRSIHIGLKSLSHAAHPPDVVIIHDVVRPFVDAGTVFAVATYAKLHGAAGVTRPLVSTVISGDDDDKLVQSLDRSQYTASEMPQAFLYTVILTAYNKADANDLDFGTECLLLALKHTGSKAKLISGADNLWKITYKKDLYASEGILKERVLKVQVRFPLGEDDHVIRSTIEDACRNKSISVVTDGANLCNSFVFVYPHFSETTVLHNTDSADSGCIKEDHAGQIVLPCVIHACIDALLDTESQEKFTQEIQMRSQMASSQQCTIYGIVCRSSSMQGKLGNMIASLVWNREQTLSGQTFVLP